MSSVSGKSDTRRKGGGQKRKMKTKKMVTRGHKRRVRSKSDRDKDYG